jgi:hypothetical protein
MGVRVDIAEVAWTGTWRRVLGVPESVGKELIHVPRIPLFEDVIGGKIFRWNFALSQLVLYSPSVIGMQVLELLLSSKT